MIGQGYAGVFVSLFNESGEVITNKVTKLTYVHSEDLEDSSTIVIKFENPALVDHPNLQVDQRIIVAWGYLNEKEKAQKRVLYIQDTRHDFLESGVRITLDCMNKAGYLKYTSRNGAGKLSLDELTSIITKDAGIEYGGFDFTPEVLKIVTDPSRKERAVTGTTTGTIKEKNITIDPSQNQVAKDETAISITQKIFVMDGQSDSSTLKEHMARQEMQDLLLVGRDDKIFITKRQWAQKALRLYEYKKEPGHLLNFMIGTHNKEGRKQASQLDFTHVDAFDRSLKRGTLNASNNTSPAMGKVAEMTRESLVQFPGFNDVSVMVAGLRKKTSTKDDEGNEVVTYSEVEYLNANDTFVAVIDIRGTTTQLDELEPLMFIDDPLDDKYSNPPIAAHLGFQDGTSRKLKTDHARRFNATHSPDKGWDGKGIGLITRLVPVSIKDYLNVIEDSIEAAAATAYNKFTEEQLKANESSADVIGDPGLVSSKIISIANVGAKWSGNYYIHRVTHTISKSKGYICKLELYKNSHNKVSGLPDQIVEARDIGKPINDFIASSEAQDQGSELKVVTEEVRPDIGKD